MDPTPKISRTHACFNQLKGFPVFLALACVLFLSAVSPHKVRTLFNSLDTTSLPQQLAFYDLYPQTPQGQQALQNVYTLLNYPLPSDKKLDRIPSSHLYAVNAIVSLVNKPPDTSAPVLSENELRAIEQIAHFLPNRKLKGYGAQSEEEVLGLEAEEVDIARGLLLSEMGNEPDAMQRIRTYEATLDLMALQILCKIKLSATPEAKIRAINHLIYSELGFRYPAHSTYAQEIDLYSFLPSVLDSRRGVCLGVSLLYLALAQRLDLSLEIVTPPGHIYVRYKNGKKVQNIETTARGIHIDCASYLGINTRSLQTRTMKEAVGSAHFNQAAVFWEQQNYSKAIASYRHALQYLSHDPFVKELLGYNLILQGNEEEGRALLEEIRDVVADHLVNKDIVVDDYLDGKTDASGLAAIFMRVDETHQSLMQKKAAIEEAVLKFPQFRAGWFYLAVSWLQLQRDKEALAVLQKYHELNPQDVTAEYYLAALYAQRYDYNKAWEHLENAEALAKTRDHEPECLEELRRSLKLMAPRLPKIEEESG